MRNMPFQDFTFGQWMKLIAVIIFIVGFFLVGTRKPSASAKQSQARQLLQQIYTMQQAYYEEFHTYCLDRVVASVDSPYAFARIGIEIDSSDTYQYFVFSDSSHFTCVCSANIDNDPEIDAWVVGNDWDILCIFDDAQWIDL